ncbi:hypothetical protein ACUXJ3_001510 [Staphylococcus capitis]
MLVKLFISEIVHTEDSFLLKLYYKFNFATEPVIITCIITLILSCIINKKRVLIGVLLIIGGILNFIFISFFGILSGILILVAGILALVRK